MSRHLIVAHQTAASPELIAELQRVAGEDREAEFVLLVPATPVSSLLVRHDEDAAEIARSRAVEAASALRSAGLSVVDTVVGAADPLQAIVNEVDKARDPYASVIISTLPAGLSQWLKRDLPSQAKKKLSIPIRHVTSRSHVEAGSRR